MTELALPPGFPAADAVWIHEDPTGISAAAARGVSRAERKDWRSGPLESRASDFRAWLVYRSWLAASFAGTAGFNSERGALGISPDYEAAAQYSGSSERARVVCALGNTAALLRAAMPPGRYDAKMMQTKAGGDVGVLPLVTIAVIAVSVAVASAAVAFLAHEAKQVVDNYLARNALLADLAENDAKALRVLDAHVAAEKEAGTPLPLGDAEKRVLDLLEQRQKTTAQKISGSSPVSSGDLPWWIVPSAIAAAIAAALIFGKAT